MSGESSARELVSWARVGQITPPSALLSGLSNLDHNFPDDELERVTQQREVVWPTAILVRVRR